MSEALLVTASWPIPVLSCPSSFDAGWVPDLDAKVAKLFARQEPFALITDTTPVTTFPAARERKQLGEWAARPDQLALQKKWNVGAATILRNAVMRGGLQALYWFWAPPCPQHAARDFDDAWSWCAQQVEKRGVRMPAPEGELKAIALRELSRARGLPVEELRR